MFEISAWSPANFQTELPAPGKPGKKQEGVQGKYRLRIKKRSLKSVTLAVNHKMTTGMA